MHMVRTSMAPSEKKLAKKAHKFIRVLAKRLNEEQFAGKRKKLKKLFKRAIQQLPEDLLRATLLGDLPTYLSTLEQSVNGETAPDVLTEVNGNEADPQTPRGKKKAAAAPQDASEPAKKRKISHVDVSDSFHFNLYLNKRKITRTDLSETQHRKVARCLLGQTITSVSLKKLNKLLQDATNEADDWMKRTEVLLHVITGNQQPLVLKQAMLYLSRVLTEEYESILQLKVKKLKNVQEKLKQFLAFLHYKWTKLEQTFSSPSYMDLMAALLSVYADLIVVLSRNSEDVKSVPVRHLMMMSSLYVEPEYVYDVILQQAAAQAEDAHALSCFWRSVLLKPVSVSQCPGYTKYMCTYRHLQPLLQASDKNDCLKVALTILPPADYLSWLLELDSSVIDDTPLTAASPGGAVTRYLVEEAADDFMEKLLNFLTAESSCLEEEATPAPEPSAQSASEAAPLFFVDRSAETGPQTEAAETADSEADVYEFTEEDIDRELAGQDKDEENSTSEDDDDEEDDIHIEGEFGKVVEKKMEDGKKETTDIIEQDVEDKERGEPKDQESDNESAEESDQSGEDEDMEEGDSEESYDSELEYAEKANAKSFLDNGDESEENEEESGSLDEFIVNTDDEESEDQVSSQEKVTSKKARKVKTTIINSDDDGGNDDNEEEEVISPSKKARKMNIVVVSSDDSEDDKNEGNIDARKKATLKNSIEEESDDVQLEEGSTEEDLPLEKGALTKKQDQVKSERSPHPHVVHLVSDDEAESSDIIEVPVETRLTRNEKSPGQRTGTRSLSAGSEDIVPATHSKSSESPSKARTSRLSPKLTPAVTEKSSPKIPRPGNVRRLISKGDAQNGQGNKQESPKNMSAKSIESPSKATEQGSRFSPRSFPEKSPKTKSPKTNISPTKSPKAPKESVIEANKLRKNTRKSVSHVDLEAGGTPRSLIISPRQTRTGRILDSPSNTPSLRKLTPRRSEKSVTANQDTKKDLYDFTSDVETPVPLRSVRATKKQAAEISIVTTPKKLTRAAQIIEDTTSQRRSRRLSTSSVTSEITETPAAEQETPVSAVTMTTPRRAGRETPVSVVTMTTPRRAAVGDRDEAKTPRQGTPFMTKSTRRRSMAPALGDVKENSPTKKISPRKALSAEKKKPVTRRRSAMISQLENSPSISSPVTRKVTK